LTNGIDKGVDSVARPNLSDQLTRQVLDLIRSENLRPGDRLPSAKSLADRFSVATPTLREALRRLQTTGVIAIKHGSGIYVRSTEERLVLANPVRDNVENSTVLDLLDARLLIEPHLCELAAGNVDDAKIAELNGLLDEAERHLEGNDEMLYRANMSFHRAIGRFSGNRILAQVLESLIELHSSEQLAIMSLYDNRIKDYQEHRGILNVLKGKDASQAHELMRKHLEDVKSIVQDRLTKDGSVAVGAASG
jgi:GntR family transcriptional repressor for pyruvate dehydrogenase complex